jgi:hypothetical protein
MLNKFFKALLISTILALIYTQNSVQSQEGGNGQFISHQVGE